MIGDIMHAAAHHFQVCGRQLIDCAQDVELMLKLGDWVLEAIESSSDPALRPAQEIIARLRTRDIYRLVFTCTLYPGVELPHGWLEKLKADIVASCSSLSPHQPVTADDFVLDVIVINYGKGSSDPLKNILFFNPKRPSQPLTTISPSASSQSPLFAPFSFEERTLMVLSDATRMVQFVRHVNT
ncbi:hypothetical protein ERJ75_000316300 [Trypanosoma vivax]|nr:hypothetical protein ERJ75_000316300 [Trypanosoma vivax]